MILSQHFHLNNASFTVTEREIRHGIVNMDDAEDQCLVYIREFEGIDFGDTRVCPTFIDMSGSEVNRDTLKYLNLLKKDILPAKLPEDNFVRLRIPWLKGKGIHPDVHREYIEDFCKDFYEKVTAEVDTAVKKHEALSKDPLYIEVLQHLHTCSKLCMSFQGRSKVLQGMREYLQGSSREPFVLFGESGCGKTAIMAKGYSKVRI